MIQLSNVSKRYEGVSVLENIDLKIENGDTFCLLGKNGAGKTTLISLILDLVPIDGGDISIFNKAHTSLDTADKRNIGSVIDNIALIDEISANDYLTLVGKIYKLDKTTIEKRISDLFHYFFENDADINKNIGNFSLGMKKKLSFCAAVIHTPDMLILDEPFSGLDPLVANQMILFIKKYQSPDRLIFISSHDLSYVEKVATHIAVLDNKVLVYNASLKEFTQNGQEALDSALLTILKPNTTELNNISWL